MNARFQRKHIPKLVVSAIVATVCLMESAAGGSVPVVVFADGRVHHPIVVSPDASPRVLAVAGDLAGMLGRMTGGAFGVVPGDGTTGIAVGTASGFPTLGLTEQLAVNSLADREHYVLRSHAHGLHALGATETAVEDAVWDLLYRLGYRQFFPGETWEVVPFLTELSIELDVDEKPDYLSRRIWYGYGLWGYNTEAYQTWCRRNRAVQDFVLSTGHAYDRIIRRNKAAFEAHPEYYGLVAGERRSSKMCIGNPDLRDLIVRDAVSQFEANPELECISMDPSDGGGWCECERCAALGTVTDRALTLANAVAAAVTQVKPGAHVGMYAYNQHSPPPTITAHPNVIVSIATGFIRGGYTVEQLFAAWGEKTRQLGVREYYSVFPWDYDLPGRGRASNLDYLRENIPALHAKGGRFLSAESGDNWGPHGLGYYVASRILWDIDEAKSVDALVDDFLGKAFGSAKEPMGEFYRLINGANRHPLSGDLVGRMYRALEAAGGSTTDAAVLARLRDLTLYTRYVELYRSYSQASGDIRQAAFEALIRHGYRIRETMMVHARALYRDLARRDKRVTIPEDATWNAPEETNPWKDSTPFTSEEVQGIMQAGIAANRMISFRPVAYGSKLVPAGALIPSELPAAAAPEVTMRGTNRLFLWVPERPARITLRVTGGLIPHYRDRGNVRLELIPDEQEFGEAVDHGDVPPDGEEREVVLTTTYTGLHILQVADGSDKTRIRWPDDLAVSLPCSLAEGVNWQGNLTFVFWVPQGVRTIGAFVKGTAEFVDGSGEKAGIFSSAAGDYVSLPVPAEQDGALWALKNVRGRVALMTVPPYVAVKPSGLLLPDDVDK